MLILSFCEPWSKGVTGRQDPSDHRKVEKLILGKTISQSASIDFSFAHVLKKIPMPRSIPGGHGKGHAFSLQVKPDTTRFRCGYREAQCPLLISSGCSQDQGAARALPRCLTGTKLCSPYVLSALCKLRMCSQGKEIKRGGCKELGRRAE